jgi:hypothetical protein
MEHGKHARQWLTTLETYAYPVIGDLNVADIDEASLAASAMLSKKTGERSAGPDLPAQ